MISVNHSYFFVPFKVDSLDIWKTTVESMRYINKKGDELGVWKRIVDTLPVHLMKYVNDGVGYNTERQYAYELCEKREYGIPYTDGNKKILKTILKRNEKVLEVEFDISHIRMHMFGTGIGILVYDISYSDEMDYESILEFNYQFKKMGIDKFIIDNCQVDRKEKMPFMYNLSQNIVSCNSACLTKTEIFFNAVSKVKMQANVFCILSDSTTDNIDNKLFHLARAYNSDYQYSEYAESSGITVYNPYSYVHWGYCEQGIACVYSDVCKFTHNQLPGNLQNDYYFMYLILLHQRYMLLDLMDKTLICKKGSIGEWKKIQESLLDFEIEYSFNVISDEMTYHKIYSDMRSKLSVIELENDINDVSNRMYVLNQEEEKKCANEIHEQEEISADIRSRRTDIVLGLLSLLAIFSALVDSTDVINEWCSKDDKVTLLWPHFLSYGIIGIVTLVVVCFLIHSYLQYRKIKNKNKDKRRK